MVELPLEAIELLVGQAKTGEEGDVLDVRPGEAGHRRMILKAMATPTLRPVRPDDVEAAAEMILRNDWGVRREWLHFAAAHSECVPLLFEARGSIVATGVGTANGPVGWIGTIFVEPAWRGQGLGRSITQAIIDRLDAVGCRTLVLVATREGRLLYERMGFEVQTRYRILEAPGIAASPSPGPAAAVVRPFATADFEKVAALDRRATGEDRAHALRRFADPGSAKVLAAADGQIEGFVVRAPWGGGATVATSVPSALAIVDARRASSGPAGRVRVGVLEENAEGLEALTAAGFVHQWSAPRMIRGDALSWQPEWIWGQLNHAMG
jgi:GNAT superfamily N-acetyltransferase